MYENIRVPHLGVKYVFDRGKLVPLRIKLIRNIRNMCTYFDSLVCSFVWIGRKAYDVEGRFYKQHNEPTYANASNERPCWHIQ